MTGRLLLLTLVLLWTSCYSFKEGQIDPNIKTVTIHNVENISANGNSAIGQGLTDALKNRFLTQTNLALVNYNGDIEYKGKITGYTIQGQAPTADETTAINRLTMTVRFEFINHIDESKSWEETFSAFSEYESTQSLVDVEDDLLSDIDFQLVEAIYNKSLVNW